MATTTTTTTIIECDDCGQANRVPATLPAGKHAVCGRCKTRLDQDDDDEAEIADIEGGHR